jgi:capsule biosynthesis phosphatase
MIEQNNVLVVDIDGTICEKRIQDKSYLDLAPKYEVIKKLINYKNNGFYIILYTSRQMKTYDGNIGKINANTAKNLFEWLDRYSIPFDEIHFGKPWCGKNGFYIDDRAIRPSEFLKFTFEELLVLLEGEN